jgi:hypothetical protein
MPKQDKSPKKVKNDVIIPFDGEENFVVPKKGGFGQADMEGYVMITGRGLGSAALSNTQTGAGSSATDVLAGSPRGGTSGSTTVSSGSTDPRFQLPSTGTPTPPPTPTPTPLDPTGTLGGSYGGGAVGSGTNLGDAPPDTQAGTRASTIISTGIDRPELGVNTTVSSPNTITFGNTRFTDLPSGGTGTSEGVIRDVSGNVITSPVSNVPVTPPTDDTPQRDLPPLEGEVISNIPLFPNLSSMNCADLTSEIARLSSIMATSKFTPEVGNAYNNQLASAKSLYENKCTRQDRGDEIIFVKPPIFDTPTPTPPTPIDTPVDKPIDTPVGGGGFGGGGFGGGGGIEPEPEQPPVEEGTPAKKDNRMGIIVLLAVIGGLYFLTRK